MKRKRKTVAEYIRRSAEYRAWKKRQLAKHDYRCWITGRKSKSIHVHHLHVNFYKVLNLIMNSLGLSYGTPIKSIPKPILNRILRLFWNRHVNIQGVPLLKKVHENFHKRYGRYNNNINQLKEFKHDFYKNRK